MEILVILGLAAALIIWGLIAFNSMVIEAAAKNMREYEGGPDSTGETSGSRFFTCILVFHHSLLGIIVFVSEPRVEYGFVYQAINALYTAVQFIFLWFLKLASEKHPAVNFIYKAGLSMLSIALVLLLVFNWGAMSKQGLLFQSAVFKSQMYLTGLAWLLTITAALYWRRYPEKYKKRENPQLGMPTPLKLLAVAGGGLALAFILLWTFTGYYVKPLPFKETMTAHQLGHMTIMAPQDWETDSWIIRGSWPGLSYFEMTETSFTDPDQGDEEYEALLKDLYKHGHPEDVSHLLDQPALISSSGIADEAKGFCGLTFMAIIQFDRGYLTLHSDWMSSREPYAPPFKRPWPCSFSTGNKKLNEAEISKHKTAFVGAVKNFLSSYHWAGPDSPPDSSSYKTRYGYISSGAELGQLYSKAYFKISGQKSYQGYLGIMTGTGLSKRDQIGLITGSTVLNKIDRAFNDISAGRRSFFSQSPKVLDERKGTEFIQGWLPLFGGHKQDCRSLKAEFAWYDDRYDPQTVVTLRMKGYEVEDADLESGQWAGLWEAITESARFAAP